jgi:hypothetical protein
MHRRSIGFVSLILIVTAVAWATQPAWWTDSGNGTAFIDANFTGNTYFTNYAPLNIGQLKNVATKAKAYLDIQLASVGGSGPNITAEVSNFTYNGTADYSPANLGQLKAVAQPFYDRLIAVQYNTTLSLQLQGVASPVILMNSTVAAINNNPDWNTSGNQGVNATYSYPWNPATNVSVNYAPANLGQIKIVFSFDLSPGNAVGYTIPPNLDAYNDGIPDAWAVTNGLNPFDPNLASEDPAGDGLTNLQKYEMGLNPQVKDNPAVALVVFTPLQ